MLIRNGIYRMTPILLKKSETDQGYSWQTRLWIDDMFMITAVQSQAYRSTKNRKYIDRTAKEMVLYLDKLQFRETDYSIIHLMLTIVGAGAMVGWLLVWPKYFGSYPRVIQTGHEL